jgi:hypothetical protein
MTIQQLTAAEAAQSIKAPSIDYATRESNNQYLRETDRGTTEYHKQLRIVDRAKLEKAQVFRMEAYREMVEKNKSVEKELIRQDDKKDDRIRQQYKEEQYLVELFSRGMYIDLLA